MVESKTTEHANVKTQMLSLAKAERHNSQIANIRCCHNGGKQNDIILKFQKSDVVNRCSQWRKATRDEEEEKEETAHEFMQPAKQSDETS